MKQIIILTHMKARLLLFSSLSLVIIIHPLGRVCRIREARMWHLGTTTAAWRLCLRLLPPGSDRGLGTSIITIYIMLLLTLPLVCSALVLRMDCGRDLGGVLQGSRASQARATVTVAGLHCLSVVLGLTLPRHGRGGLE